MNDSAEFNRETKTPIPIVWFRNLFFLKIITTILSVLLVFPGLSTTISWINRMASVGIIVALFQLSITNKRYRKAATFLSIAVGGGLIGSLLEQNLLTMAASICSIIALYHEFYAHSELAADIDAKLSGKWRSLFYWQFVVGIIASFITTAGVTICVLAGIDSPVIISILLWTGTILGVIIELIYLFLLKKTIIAFDDPI